MEILKRPQITQDAINAMIKRAQDDLEYTRSTKMSQWASKQQRTDTIDRLISRINNLKSIQIGTPLTLEQNTATFWEFYFACDDCQDSNQSTLVKFVSNEGNVRLCYNCLGMAQLWIEASET